MYFLYKCTALHRIRLEKGNNDEDSITPCDMTTDLYAFIIIRPDYCNVLYMELILKIVLMLLASSEDYGSHSNTNQSE